MAIAITGTSASASASSGASTATAVQDQQDRFLKLLVTQMKNQDPLNPLDNAQVTSQMAQLSTVTGIEKLNATLAAYAQAQSFQSVNMIGHAVLAPGDFVQLKSGAAVGGLDLAQAADTVKVSIADGSGKVVRELNLGKKDAGVSAFTWDGQTTAGAAAADGSYTFAVNATLAGEQVTATRLAVGQVNSVLMDKAGPALSVGGLGLVDLSAVRQVM
ncbi:MAG TPA: flagellar hook assembly protein FlgD [Novimethylophilus sp.]|jgi:flagellar basal-body rod modification protein FlgD|uniref:flagellar hook assembly protein FlgD n=1 Tax=Novimethylophilus sp. TaxID=2137426 RepID=UPI002F4177B9